ncbi:hypothetical protein D9M71_93140 [compost metagenome]
MHGEAFASPRSRLLVPLRDAAQFFEDAALLVDTLHLQFPLFKVRWNVLGAQHRKLVLKWIAARKFGELIDEALVHPGVLGKADPAFPTESQRCLTQLVFDKYVGNDLRNTRFTVGLVGCRATHGFRCPPNDLA